MQTRTEGKDLPALFFTIDSFFPDRVEISKTVSDANNKLLAHNEQKVCYCQLDAVVGRNENDSRHQRRDPGRRNAVVCIKFSNPTGATFPPRSGSR